MLPKTHVIIGLISIAIISLIFPAISLLGLAIIFASSVLIDVDHYVYYVWKKRDLSLRNAYIWFTSVRRRIPRYLHRPDVIAILLVLSFHVSIIFFYILIGFMIHILSDEHKNILRCVGFRGRKCL